MALEKRDFRGVNVYVIFIIILCFGRAHMSIYRIKLKNFKKGLDGSFFIWYIIIVEGR